ncbi:MAG TPA: hypothetical protein VET85_17660 [Stellaceae bacterium]|nr:hypothetical protein [Stellaceae bacterium]
MTNMHRELAVRTLAVRLLGETSGATAVMVALVSTMVLGAAGLGSEAALWYVTQRNMQGAADSAAYGAVIAAAAGGGPTVFTSEAKSEAAKLGFVDQVANTTVTVNKPPKSGNYTATTSAIEVIVQQPQTRFLSALYLANNPTIAARAVAVQGGGPYCVLALDGNASVDAFVNGTTNINLIACGLAVDSNSSTALDIVGNATITAASASIVGNVSTSGGGTLTTANGTVTGAPTIPDPYANMSVPAFAGCNYTNFVLHNHQTQTIDASNGTDVFCGGIQLNGGSSLTLQNGTFVLDQGTLSVAGGATFTVNNGTIVLSSSTGANFATVSIAGGAVVNVTAPATGSAAGIVGMAFFQDRRAPKGVSNDFRGGATQTITGAIYLPTETVAFAGGTQTGTGCTQIVADTIDFKGNANLEINCTGKGVKAVTTVPQLVE